MSDVMGDNPPERSLRRFGTFLSDVQNNYGVKIDDFDVTEGWLEEEWKKYSPMGELKGRVGFNPFSAKWEEITCTLLELLKKTDSLPEVIDKTAFDQLKQTKPLQGLSGISIGGFELAAFIPFGLDVTAVDPRFGRYNTPTGDNVPQWINDRLTSELIKNNKWEEKFDIVSSSRVFAFSSGAGEFDEQQELFLQCLHLMKPSGLGVHTIGLDDYRQMAEPLIKKGELKESFKFPQQTLLLSGSSDLITVLHKESPQE